MTISDNGLKLIEGFEGCLLHAYWDKHIVGCKPITIGWGCTRYRNGTPIQITDTITQQGADDLFKWTATNFATVINALLKTTVINQNQFDALVSLSYNIGIDAFAGSTILKKVRLNLIDPAIRYEFSRWNKSGGEVIDDLVTRRAKEADYYFS